MPINFNPVAGTILICDFSGSIPPEMNKRRPVVVLSPAFKGRYKLATVAALSTTDPDPIASYHFRFALNPPLPMPFDKPQMWVKGDMVFSASYDRLDRFKVGKNSAGMRIYRAFHLPPGILPEIQKAVLNGLGLGRLTPHL